MNFLKKTIIFLREVKKEAKKINWLKKQEVIRYTSLVLGVSLVVALFLGIFDFIFFNLLNKIIFF